MDASRGMYLDVETLDLSDFEVQVVRQRRVSGAGATRTAGAVAVLMGVGAAVALVTATRSRSTAAPVRAEALAAVGLEAVPVSQESDLRPIELLHDGNVCEMNEELYGGLCYKKCQLLTEGLAAIRTSPWSCCESSPCSFAKEHVGAPMLCHGYDVSGRGGCPHKPGSCLVDEEMYFGQCFKKCALLTAGKFPFRTAPATCCRTKGLGCLNFGNDLTSPDFDIGGGGGDSDPSTPSGVHPPLQSLTEESGLEASSSSSSSSAAAASPDESDLRPLENTHDGNVCGDAEELWEGLCYKKCNLLTSGVAPIRTSSWTCCESHPCGLKNEHGSLGTSILCNGFDVADEGRCPHRPGACLVDEEMHLGVCYKKCGLLTGGTYPHRIGPMSCCKSTSGLGCFNLLNDKTSASFDVGGGRVGEESQAHMPEVSLTEASSASASTFGVPSADSLKVVMKKRLL